MKTKFRLDRSNGKIMGVCAGLANHFNVDVTFVRVGAVLVTLLGAFPWTLLAYGVAAWMGKPSPAGDRGHGLHDQAVGRSSLYDHRASTRDIDRRIAEVDTYVAGTDSRLAREIEELR